MDQDFTILGKNIDRLVQIKIKDLRVWENVSRKKKTWIEEKVANRTIAHSIVGGSNFVEAMYHFVVSRFAVTHFGVPLSADCEPMIEEMSVNKGGNPQVEWLYQ